MTLQATKDTMLAGVSELDVWELWLQLLGGGNAMLRSMALM